MNGPVVRCCSVMWALQLLNGEHIIERWREAGCFCRETGQTRESRITSQYFRSCLHSATILARLTWRHEEINCVLEKFFFSTAGDVLVMCHCWAHGAFYFVYNMEVWDGRLLVTGTVQSNRKQATESISGSRSSSMLWKPDATVTPRTEGQNAETALWMKYATVLADHIASRHADHFYFY